MAFNYAGLESTALNLINRFGRSVTLRRETVTKNASRPWQTTQADSDTAITAVVEDFSARELVGTTIQEGDKRILFAGSGLSITPKAGDFVVDGGVVYRLVSVEQTKPGGTALIYTAQGRL